MTDCPHDSITVYREADHGPMRMWACADCHRRFYPACPVCVDVGHRNEAHVEVTYAVTDATPKVGRRR
jgi:hypothetical protein